MGRSNCVSPPHPIAIEAHAPTSGHTVIVNDEQQTSFFCDDNKEPWITEEGWFEMLRQFSTASAIPETNDNTWELLWLFVPDYQNQGQMGTITSVPNSATEPEGKYWAQ